MDIFKLLILGIVIGSNNFSAALALGALGQAHRRWRVVAVFGCFEFLIPLVGIWIGRKASVFVEQHISWLAPGLLAAMGIWTIYEAFRGTRDRKIIQRLTTWTGLALLALGLSIDNLVVGFSLGIRGEEPLVVASTIAVFSMSFAWIGMKVGKQARRHWERYAGLAAGLLLLGLAVAVWLGWL